MATTVANDAFWKVAGRPRSTTPAWTTEPLLWETTSRHRTCTHLPNESAARLSVGATSGDAVVRQSRYITYRPGKSRLVMVTGTVATSGALSWTEVR